MALDCIKDIIGISETDCGCITDGLTEAQLAEMRISKSGLYLDKLPGGVSLVQLKDADGCKSMFDLAIDAKKEAIKTVEDDILTVLSANFSKNRNSFIGTIGTSTTTRFEIKNTNIIGLRIVSNSVSDAVLRIQKIALGLDKTINTDLLVYRIYKGETNLGNPIKSIPISSFAGTYHENILPEELVLPMRADNKALEYYLLFDRKTAQPYENKFACCSGDALRELFSFIDITGVDIYNYNDLSTKNTWANASGMILTASMRCEITDFICREYNESDEVAKVIAHAARFKAGELLIEAILQPGTITRAKFLDREYYWGKRNHFRAEYENRIKYLGGKNETGNWVIDVNNTDCFICKNTSMFYQGIMS